MKNKRIYLAIFVTVSLFWGTLFWSKASFAQVETSPLSATEVITLTAEELKTHIESLKKLYTNQIDAYRTQIRQYNLTLTQWQQLQTLSSLEEVVTAASVVNQGRADVLITYFELLHAQIVAESGLPQADKAAMSPQVIELINRLKAHKQAAAQASDREQINLVADDFEPLFKDAKIVSVRCQFLLDLAQLNRQKTTASDLFERVKTKQEELPLSEIQRAERARAYQQIEDLFANIDVIVLGESQRVASMDSKIKEKDEELSESLNKVETDLLQALSFIRELANIL